jgi:predicted MFS family arabinose efflux permease
LSKPATHVSASAGNPSTPEAEDRSSGYAWYVLGLLCFVYLSNHVDRQILMILLEPIKDEFGATDFQMGLLTGPAFALFYTIAGIPIARWADRGSRKTIIAISVALWSLMTALSGAARGFASLAMLRVGVGIGEAGCSPPSHSLISDYFPPNQRARAMGFFSAGSQAGAAFGWLLGGWLYLYFGWRYAFVVVGVPGLLLALLVAMTVREPTRGGIEKRSGTEEPEPLWPALRSLMRQRTYFWLQIGGAFHAISGYGLAVWVAPYLIRVHGLEIHVIGTWLGLIALLAGVPGIFLGGYLCDRLSPRDARWYLWIPTLAAVFGLPFTALFLFLPDANWALFAYAGHSILNLAYTAPIYAVTQAVVKLRTRSLAVALHLFIANLIGLGLGPVVIGGLNDLLRPEFGDGAIRYTMMFAASANLVACIFYLLAARSVKRDIEFASS